MCEEKLDFRPLGHAIKQARIDRGLPRGEVARFANISTRYLANVENMGQQPSLQVLYKLAIRLGISVDQFFFSETAPQKSTRQRQVAELLEKLTDVETLIVVGTIHGILEAKEAAKS